MTLKKDSSTKVYMKYTVTFILTQRSEKKTRQPDRIRSNIP